MYEPLMKFVRKQAESTDIFCFQEVFRSPKTNAEVNSKTRINILDELAAALPDFKYVFHPAVSGVDNYGPVDFEIETGQAEFIKKSISIISSGEISAHSPRNITPSRKQKFSPNNFGYSRISYGNSVITVINVHGLTYRPDDKLDTPERLEQSRLIKEFTLNEKGNILICGDFNVLPETESIAIFYDSFTELVKKFSISTTRSKISPWYGTPEELKFSDYVFVSPSIEIIDFKVPYIEVSDHLPLILEFN